MPQESNYHINNLENFPIDLNIDYSQSETIENKSDKELQHFSRTRHCLELSDRSQLMVEN